MLLVVTLLVVIVGGERVVVSVMMKVVMMLVPVYGVTVVPRENLPVRCIMCHSDRTTVTMTSVTGRTTSM